VASAIYAHKEALLSVSFVLLARKTNALLN